MGVQVKVSPNGRIVIPADVRRQLGIEKGGTLTLDVDEFGVTLTTGKQRVRKAQQLYAKMMEGKPRMSVDEFLKFRREEAKREEEEMNALGRS